MSRSSPLPEWRPRCRMCHRVRPHGVGAGRQRSRRRSVQARGGRPSRPRQRQHRAPAPAVLQARAAAQAAAPPAAAPAASGRAGHRHDGRGHQRVPAGQRPARAAVPRLRRSRPSRSTSPSSSARATRATARPAWPTCSSTCCSRARPPTPTSGSCSRIGGRSFNGTTWYDRTNYYEELPASPENLEFALALEADRMVNSTISADELAKEFSVVRNEFEMGENNPAGVLEEKMFAAAYQWHNYGKSTIGSRSDIERVPVDNLRAFYRRFYQPDNALLVVAGKFDQAKALELDRAHLRGHPPPHPQAARHLDRGAGAGRRALGAAAPDGRRRGGGGALPRRWPAPIRTGACSTPPPTSSPTSRPAACTRRWWRRAWPARCSASSIPRPSRASCSWGPRSARAARPRRCAMPCSRWSRGWARRPSPRPRSTAGAPARSRSSSWP